MSLQALDALPNSRQSDQLWRRGLAVGQLAEALLCESHGRSSEWCTLFKDPQCPESKSLDFTRDWIVTALAVSLRSLALLNSAYDRKIHMTISSSGGDKIAASKNSDLFPVDNMLDDDGINTKSNSSTSDNSKDSTRSSASGVENAMKKRIEHYAEVTMLAREQLMKLTKLSGKPAEQTVIKGDLDLRAENAIFHAVIDMSRRAAGLQALTSSCTTSIEARAHSGSHAQALFEHALCLLEDLLANAQGDTHRQKFQRLSALADNITGCLHGIRASTAGSMPGPSGIGASVGSSQGRDL